jgi:subtilisin family serine protease
MEPHWHGTAVVSLLTGDPKSGTPGLVPGADYVIADVFTNNEGRSETDTEHLLWALEFLVNQGAQVINMSLSGPRDDLVHERLIALSKKGVVFVAAAGNGGAQAPPAYPAAYLDEVVAVTAVDRNRQVYGQANQGDYIDVAAPGVRIWTAMPHGKQGLRDGTSFAAPFVTAIVAAMYNKALVPAMGNPLQPRASEPVVLAHLTTDRAERDGKVGFGLVRAPSSCGAATQQRKIPTVQPTAPIALNGWELLVRRTSSQ